MPRRPTPPDEPLREWRISKVHYLGRVVAADEVAAIDFRIEPARQFRVIAEPVEY